VSRWIFPGPLCLLQVAPGCQALLLGWYLSHLPPTDLCLHTISPLPLSEPCGPPASVRPYLYDVDLSQQDLSRALNVCGVKLNLKEACQLAELKPKLKPRSLEVAHRINGTER
jgi:hypothetical protein